MNFLLTDKEIFTLILTCSHESYSGLNPKVDSNIFLFFTPPGHQVLLRNKFFFNVNLT
jgi:hypothetical protein